MLLVVAVIIDKQISCNQIMVAVLVELVEELIVLEEVVAAYFLEQEELGLTLLILMAMVMAALQVTQGAVIIQQQERVFTLSQVEVEVGELLEDRV